jgi:fimbrial isopeptide formation D2 family protein
VPIFSLRKLISISILSLVLFFNLAIVSALPTPNFCFAHSDDGDTLHTMLVDGTSQQAAPNPAGVPDIEAIAFNPSNEVLYAIDEDRFGILNYNFADATNGGRFTAVGSGFGAINGSAGTVTISDVDSLAFDPITNILYGVDRADTDPDRLFIIDIATGTAEPNAFGTNIGYIEVTDNNPATVWDEDIDDLAIDPSTALLYAVANSGGAGDHLITLDRDTGALSDIGILTTDDMEGLSFFNDGTLYGTTGAASTAPANRNSLWRINISNANATKITTFTSDADYEAVDCLVGDPNNKSGFVFNDANGNSALDAGESPVAGVTVEIYRDTGIVSGSIDVNDRRVGTALTDSNGRYQFDLAAVGEFILQVDISSLPAGVSISDNIEIASFDNCNPSAAPFVDFGCDEPNNNFPSTNGLLPPPTATPMPTSPASATTVNSQSPAPAPANPVGLTIIITVEPESIQIGDPISFTITITNPTSQDINDVVLIDNLPDVFTVITATSSQGTVSINGNLVSATIGTIPAQQTVTVTINAEATRVALQAESCNQASVGNTQSNQVCPSVFPLQLPQTGQYRYESLRLVFFTVLLVGVVLALVISLKKIFR